MSEESGFFEILHQQISASSAVNCAKGQCEATKWDMDIGGTLAFVGVLCGAASLITAVYLSQNARNGVYFSVRHEARQRAMRMAKTAILFFTIALTVFIGTR